MGNRVERARSKQSSTTNRLYKAGLELVLIAGMYLTNPTLANAETRRYIECTNLYYDESGTLQIDEEFKDRPSIPEDCYSITYYRKEDLKNGRPLPTAAAGTPTPRPYGTPTPVDASATRTVTATAMGPEKPAPTMPPKPRPVYPVIVARTLTPTPTPRVENLPFGYNRLSNRYEETIYAKPSSSPTRGFNTVAVKSGRVQFQAEGDCGYVTKENGKYQSFVKPANGIFNMIEGNTYIVSCTIPGTQKYPSKIAVAYI